MQYPYKGDFTKKWVKYYLISLAIMEIVAIIMYIFTELGNIGSNFWLTNAFAGSWAGFFLLIHIPLLFLAAICLPTETINFWAFIMTIVNLITTALLISFNAVFLAQPSTCILGTTCIANAGTPGAPTNTFNQNFYTVWNGLGPFKNYTQSQSKYLFETVQISVGCLIFVLLLIHLAIYLLLTSQASKRITVVQPIEGFGSRQASAVPEVVLL